MGQQQLLLLVLATVIVGLATVAGIQAFSENQAQASQDALVQRGTSIASDIKGLQGRPAQMGGVDLVNNNSSLSGDDIARGIGLENNPFEAQGAGSEGFCRIAVDGTAADVECTSANAAQDVTVTYNADTDEVSTEFSDSGTFNISGTSSI